MSFVGSSFLLGHGWGTTTPEAFDKQAAEIVKKFTVARECLSGRIVEPKETDPVNAAVFLGSVPTELDWSQERKRAFSMEKRKKSHLTEKQIAQTQEWQAEQLELVKAKQKAIDALSLQDRRTLEAAVDLISILVVNLYLRQSMIYPLARDQLPNGESLISAGLDKSQVEIIQLRIIRERLAENLSDKMGKIVSRSSSLQSFKCFDL